MRLFTNRRRLRSYGNDDSVTGHYVLAYERDEDPDYDCVYVGQRIFLKGSLRGKALRPSTSWWREERLWFAAKRFWGDNGFVRILEMMTQNTGYTFTGPEIIKSRTVTASLRYLP